MKLYTDLTKAELLKANQIYLMSTRELDLVNVSDIPSSAIPLELLSSSGDTLVFSKKTADYTEYSYASLALVDKSNPKILGIIDLEYLEIITVKSLTLRVTIDENVDLGPILVDLQGISKIPTIGNYAPSDQKDVPLDIYEANEGNEVEEYIASKDNVIYVVPFSLMSAKGTIQQFIPNEFNGHSVLTIITSSNKYSFDFDFRRVFTDDSEFTFGDYEVKVVENLKMFYDITNKKDLFYNTTAQNVLGTHIIGVGRENDLFMVTQNPELITRTDPELITTLETSQSIPSSSLVAEYVTRDLYIRVYQNAIIAFDKLTYKVIKNTDPSFLIYLDDQELLIKETGGVNFYKISYDGTLKQSEAIPQLDYVLQVKLLGRSYIINNNILYLQ